MDTQSPTTRPEESKPPVATPSATMSTTASGSAAATAAQEPETSNNTQSHPLPQLPRDSNTDSATPAVSHLAAGQPAVTNESRNDTSSIELRRLSDRALPPLPPGQIQIRDAGPVVGVVPGPGNTDAINQAITDEPPPEYMSIPHNNQRSAGGRPPQRPENYVINPEDLHDQPDYVDCPHCRTRQKTIVRYENTTETNMAAVVLCLVCGILPGIIPFCCNWFNDIEHVCPNCLKVVARMPYDGQMQAVLPQASKYHASASNYRASQFQPAAGTSGTTTAGAEAGAGATSAVGGGIVS